jgi:hypothetical protein
MNLRKVLTIHLANTIRPMLDLKPGYTFDAATLESGESRFVVRANFGGGLFSDSGPIGEVVASATVRLDLDADEDEVVQSILARIHLPVLSGSDF